MPPKRPEGKLCHRKQSADFHRMTTVYRCMATKSGTDREKRRRKIRKFSAVFTVNISAYRAALACYTGDFLPLVPNA